MLIWAAVAPGISVAQTVVRMGMSPTTPACDQSMARAGSMMPAQGTPLRLPPSPAPPLGAAPPLPPLGLPDAPAPLAASPLAVPEAGPDPLGDALPEIAAAVPPVLPPPCDGLSELHDAHATAASTRNPPNDRCMSRRLLAARTRRRTSRLALPAGIAEVRVDWLGGRRGGVGGDAHAPVPIGNGAVIVLEDGIVDDELCGGTICGQEGSGAELGRRIVLDEVPAKRQVDAVAAVFVD